MNMSNNTKNNFLNYLILCTEGIEAKAILNPKRQIAADEKSRQKKILFRVLPQ